MRKRAKWHEFINRIKILLHFLFVAKWIKKKEMTMKWRSRHNVFKIFSFVLLFSFYFRKSIFFYSSTICFAVFAKRKFLWVKLFVLRIFFFAALNNIFGSIVMHMYGFYIHIHTHVLHWTLMFCEHFGMVYVFISNFPSCRKRCKFVLEISSWK